MFFRRAGHGNDMLMMFPMFDTFDPMSEKDVEASRKFIKLLIEVKCSQSYWKCTQFKCICHNL